MRYFERCAPEQEGVDAQRLRQALEKLAHPRYGAQALMVLRHGKVVGESYRAPYREGDLHSLFSVSKSFTAVAAGFAQQEGLLTLEDFLCDYFPEYLPSLPCENMRQLRLKHLLMMAAGFEAAPDDFKRHHAGEVVNDFPYSYANFKFSDEIDWAKDFLHTYVAEQPGNRFIYSSACTYMISAVIQKITGQTLLEFLQPRLLKPLGITRVQWQQCSQGRNVGGWGMSLCSEDLAKFGQFMLQEGAWEGKQLLDPAFVREMRSCQILIGNRSAKWEKRFGYQVWLLGEEEDYGGIGAFGQMYIVFPRLEAVFVMLGASRTYMKALDVIMGDLKNALQGPAEPGESVSLELEQMYLPEGLSSWDMPQAQRYTGMRYVLAPNPFGITAMKFQFGAQDQLNLEIEGDTTEVKIGYDYWEYGHIAAHETIYSDTHTQMLFSKVACAGAWKGEVYHLTLAFYETCYVLELACRFSEHGIYIESKRNVGFVKEANTKLIGVRA